MKKQYYIITLLFALLVGMTTSCEDRLNIPKHGNMGSMDDYYQTDSEVESALASMYLSWRSAYYNWWFVKNALSDDAWAAGGQRSDNVLLEQMNEYTYDTSNTMISGLYSDLYTIIYKANLIIDLVPGTTNYMKQAIAEAKVARAWSHSELVSLWGTAPIVDHLLTPNEYRQANGTPETTWAFVEQDLQDAISSGALVSKSGVNDQVTGMHLSLEAAKAFLGKAYLFQGKYKEAAAILDEVIDSQKYDLYSDYDALFHAKANNCCESIFELQFRNDAEQAWNQWEMFYIMIGWRTDKLTLTGNALSTIASGTYGFMNPRKSLYDAFVAEEGTDGYRLNCSIRNYEQMQAEGVSVAPGSRLVGNEGYFSWKTRILKEDCVIDQSYFQVLQYINHRIMRYAEVLLMAAEAHLQSGGNRALEYINKVRTRAQVEPLSSVTLDDIKTERRLELCLESCRFQDLIRWGDAESVLANQGKEVPEMGYFATDQTDEQGNPVYEFGQKWPYTNTTYGFKAKHKLLPIPLTEIEVNPNMTQNVGWNE